MARKYNSIWKELKLRGHCSVAAHVAVHARIIKAVINEKDRDVGYKIQMESIAKMKKIKYKCEGSKISFYLIEHISGSITIGDL